MWYASVSDSVFESVCSLDGDCVPFAGDLTFIRATFTFENISVESFNETTQQLFLDTITSQIANPNSVAEIESISPIRGAEVQVRITVGQCPEGTLCANRVDNLFDALFGDFPSSLLSAFGSVRLLSAAQSSAPYDAGGGLCSLDPACMSCDVKTMGCSQCMEGFYHMNGSCLPNNLNIINPSTTLLCRRVINPEGIMLYSYPCNSSNVLSPVLPFNTTLAYTGIMLGSECGDGNN